jgi:hypothetical protein
MSSSELSPWYVLHVPLLTVVLTVS